MPYWHNFSLLVAMSNSDEQFREAYKPLFIPSSYDKNDTQQNKVVFALAQIDAGTTQDVILELKHYNDNLDPSPYLRVLFDKGLIKGKNIQGVMQYNWSKMTEANGGSVDPG